MERYARPIALILTFIVGFSLPAIHVLTPLIPWFVRLMIFMIFLQIRMDQVRIRKSHIILLGLNLLIGIGPCFLLSSLGANTLGKVAFFTGIAPTATSAPTIMGFLGGNIEYVFTSFMLNTIIITLLMPLLLPWAVQSETPGVILQVAGQMGSVVILPVIAAILLRYLHPQSTQWPKKCQNVIFLAWVMVVGIICSNASYYIQTTPDLSILSLVEVGVISLLICILNFLVGYFVGLKEFAREGSQSLGQKNTSITIFLSILYSDPLVALGPTLYSLWHNLWNAWQLEQTAVHEKRTEKESIIKKGSSGD